MAASAGNVACQTRKGRRPIQRAGRPPGVSAGREGRGTEGSKVFCSSFWVRCGRQSGIVPVSVGGPQNRARQSSGRGARARLRIRFVGSRASKPLLAVVLFLTRPQPFAEKESAVNRIDDFPSGLYDPHKYSFAAMPRWTQRIGLAQAPDRSQHNN